MCNLKHTDKKNQFNSCNKHSYLCNLKHIKKKQYILIFLFYCNIFNFKLEYFIKLLLLSFINIAQIKDKYEYYNITFRYISKLLSLYIHIIKQILLFKYFNKYFKIFLTVTTTFLKILRNVKIEIILNCRLFTLITNLFLNNNYIIIIINLAKIYHLIKSLINKNSFITNVIHLSRNVKNIINGLVCHSTTISIILINSFRKICYVHFENETDAQLSFGKSLTIRNKVLFLNKPK